MGNYLDQHQRSLAEPSDYWLDIANDVHWYKKPTQGVDTSDSPFNTWFADGEINACYNAIDVHVINGRGEQLALIHDSPITDSHKTFTYSQLQDQISRFAGVLVSEGVAKGDRVMVYMPMIPEALIAVLACARIGAIHTVVFGGFASKELAVRLNDCGPKLIVTASCGIEPGRVIEYQSLVEDAIDLADDEINTCIILQRPQSNWSLKAGRDKDWHNVIHNASPADCVSLKSTDPLYILYTSGTTGSPKGVVKDTGGTVVSLKWTMSSVYNVHPGDVYWAASDIGWVVGHSYIIYGPLFQGCTTLMYEGKPVGTPDAGAFWRVLEQNKVNVLFTAPTAFRAIKRDDPTGALVKDYDLSQFRMLYLAGERCDPDTLHWAQDKLHVPVIDHWWQTETGYSICANCQGIEAMPIIPGSPSVAVPGYDVAILNDECDTMAPGEIGSIVVRLPLPPGTFTTLWRAKDRYVSAYFERFPDVINVAGHRLSTGAMEEVLSNHPDVAECAVMGANDELKGQLPVGLVILNSGITKSHDEICAELIKKVRDDIGPVAAFKSVAVVDKLPKTRSGKILRGTLRSIADSKSWKMPATIEDPSVLDDITKSLKTLGFAKDNS
jgi:propionyl-CoA synthetase